MVKVLGHHKARSNQRALSLMPGFFRGIDPINPLHSRLLEERMEPMGCLLSSCESSN